MGNVKWTEEEIKILIDNKNKTLDELMPLFPNRTHHSIKWKREDLGIKLGLIKKWTKQELNILKKNPHKSMKELSVLLPNRNKDTIVSKRNKIGIRKNTPKKWTQKELEILKNNNHLSLEELSKTINRSQDSIRKKMEKLKIHRINAVVKWSQDEIDVLRNNQNATLKELCILLPQRHLYSIKSKRCDIRIKKEQRLEFNFVYKIFESRGCQLLENEYINCGTKMKYRCRCGIISTTTYSLFKRNKNLCIFHISDEMKKINKKFRKKCESVLRITLEKMHQKKDNRSFILNGYDHNQLRERIINHPNWNKVKDQNWHLDHIFPVNAFLEYKLTDLKYIKIINGLDNLQPLGATENIIKSDKYDPTEFEHWLTQKGIVFESKLDHSPNNSAYISPQTSSSPINS